MFETEEKQIRQNFVLLSDIVPDIIQELRYFSTYNFIGERIDGYIEPCAILTGKAAEALKRVSDDLKKGVSAQNF